MQGLGEKLKEIIDSAKIIDLSQTLNSKVQAPFGQLPFTLTPAVTRNDGVGYQHNNIAINEHCATHLDVPCHYFYEGDVASQPIEKFMGKAVTINLPDVVKVEPEDIQKWEAQNGEIQAGDVVLFGFGWEDKFYEEIYFTGWPGLSGEAMEYLAEKKIKIVGLDTPTIDVDGDPSYPAHNAALSHGIIIYENLKNLKNLPKESFFIGIPIKLENGTGSPVRAVAVVD